MKTTEQQLIKLNMSHVPDGVNKSCKDKKVRATVPDINRLTNVQTAIAFDRMCSGKISDVKTQTIGPQPIEKLAQKQH